CCLSSLLGDLDFVAIRRLTRAVGAKPNLGVLREARLRAHRVTRTWRRGRRRRVEERRAPATKQCHSCQYQHLHILPPSKPLRVQPAGRTSASAAATSTEEC